MMKVVITILKYILKNWIAVLFIAIAIFSLNKGHSSFPQVVFLDVGQGDSILIEQDDFQILVDGGGDDAVLFELPKYMDLFDKTIEVLVLTHAHDDHLLGLLEVLENYEVEDIWYAPSCSNSLSYKFLTENYAEKLRKVQKGVKLVYGDLNVSVIYPVDIQCKTNLNNESVVLQLDIKNQSFLLMGDAEKEVEEELLGDLEHIDVLKAGHHCSRTASSEMFLNIVNPTIAICSCGEENKFGHPHNETLEKFKNNNVQYLITYENGNIVFEIY